MEASSRAALVLTRERLEQVSRGADAEALGTIADELFAVSRLLDEQRALRRALTDPSATPDNRAGLVQRLLGDRVSTSTLDVMQTAVRHRWSRGADLVETTERLAIEAALDAAAEQGHLDTVEDELFRFGRIVAGNSELSRILSDRLASPEGKAQLLDRLLGGRVDPVTEQLLRNVLTLGRLANADLAIEDLSIIANRRRGRWVAQVTTAVPLTARQEQRLADVLTRIYGRPVGLQVDVDPDVLGGLVIQVGDEVIDGSIAQRLETARRQLAG